MAQEGLPAAMVEALSRGERLRYEPTAVECGAVTFNDPDGLRETVVWVDGDERGWDNDPHRREVGHYIVPIVDLLATADGYDPQGILVWIPALGAFGSWDCDHWDLIVFTGSTWDDITADPARFLNAQWAPGGEYLRPWEHGFEWRPGRPC